MTKTFLKSWFKLHYEGDHPNNCGTNVLCSFASTIHAIDPSAHWSLFSSQIFCTSYFHACVPFWTINADHHVLTVILRVSVSKRNYLIGASIVRSYYHPRLLFWHADYLSLRNCRPQHAGVVHIEHGLGLTLQFRHQVNWWNLWYLEPSNSFYFWLNIQWPLEKCTNPFLPHLSSVKIDIILVRLSLRTLFQVQTWYWR